MPLFRFVLGAIPAAASCMDTGERDFFALQLEILQARWPSLWKSLVSSSMPHDVVIERGRGCTTAVIRGIHLTSGVNRRAEALLQAAEISTNAEEAWVYGLALGDLPRVLLERQALTRLHVVVMDGATALFSFSRFDHLDWLQDERVQLHLAWELPRLNRPCCVAPSSLRLASGAALGLRDALVIELAAPSRDRELARKEGIARVQREEAREFWESDADVQALYGRCKGKKVLVLGAGPTLSLRENWLRDNRETLSIVAVTTALRPLAKMGMVADFAVVIESNPETIEHFRGLDEERYRTVPLVYVPGVKRETLEKWPGPRYGACLDSEGLERSERAKLFCSGTVLHAAVDFAVQAGAQEVLLLGADFSYPMGQAYASGAHGEREQTGAGYRVENGLGQQLLSAPNLIMFLRDLEQYIAAHREVRFYNLGIEGAKIAGAKCLREGGEA